MYAQKYGRSILKIWCNRDSAVTEDEQFDVRRKALNAAILEAFSEVQLSSWPA
jgi:hypothetical protein